MEVEIYTMENGKFRFSFMGEQNQIALGLDKLLPEPRFKLYHFVQSTGHLTFDLGREGVLLTRSEGPLKIGLQMRATASGHSLGIEGVYGEETLVAPLLRVRPGRYQLVMPHNFYKVRSDVLPGI